MAAGGGQDLILNVLMKLNADTSGVDAAVSRLQSSAASSAGATGGVAASPVVPLKGTGVSATPQLAGQFLLDLQRSVDEQAAAFGKGGSRKFSGATRAISKLAQDYQKQFAEADADAGREFARFSSPITRRNLIQQQQSAAATARAEAEFQRSSANLPPNLARLGPTTSADRKLLATEQGNAIDEARRLVGGSLNEQFKGDLTVRDTAFKAFYEAMERARLATEDYVTQAVNAASAHRSLEAAVLRGAAAEDEYIAATAGLAASRKLIADKSTIAGTGVPPSALGGLSAQQIKDQAAEIRRVQSLNDRARQAANVSQQESDALNRFQAAQRFRADTAAAARSGATQDEVKARGGVTAVAGAQRLEEASNRRAAAMDGETREQRVNIARNRAVEAARQNEISGIQKQILKQQIKSGELGGTAFQRFQASVSAGSGRTPLEFARFGDFIKQRFASTAGFAVSGIVTSQVLFGLVDAVKNANALEVAMIRLRSQLKAVGSEGSFGQVRDGIKRISAETGIAGRDVAEFFSRALGTFGRGPTDALNQTEAAMKLAVVTGLELGDMMDSVIPAAKAFGVGIEEIGNVAVELGEKFGVPEDEVTGFLGKAAVVAKETGIQLRDLSAIGGVMRQNLGKDLGSSADFINKLPGQIAQNIDQITAILSKTPKTAGFIQPLQAALATGAGGDAINALLQAAAIPTSEGGLSDRQLSGLAGLVINKKSEIEEGTVLLRKAREELDKINDPNFLAEGSNALDERYKSLSGTLQITFQKLGTQIENFADALLRSGFADVFKTAGASAGVFLGIISQIADLFAHLNDATKIGPFDSGLLSAIGSALLVVKGIQVALTFLAGIKDRNTAASLRLTAAELSEAAARRINSGAATTEATVTGSVSAANGLQILSASGAAAGGVGAGVAGAGVAGAEGGGTIAGGALGGPVGIALATAAVAMTALVSHLRSQEADDRRSTLDNIAKTMSQAEVDKIQTDRNLLAAIGGIFTGSNPDEIKSTAQTFVQTKVAREDIQGLSDSGAAPDFFGRFNDQQKKDFADYINKSENRRKLWLDRFGGTSETSFAAAPEMEEGRFGVTHEDYWDQIFGGNPTGQNTFATFDPETLKKHLPDLVAIANDIQDPLNKAANDIILRFQKELGLPENSDILARARNQAVLTAKQKAAKAEGIGNYVSGAYDRLKQQLDEGSITAGYFESQIPDLLRQTDAAQAGQRPEDEAEAAAKAVQIHKDAQEFIKNQWKKRMDATQRMLELTSANPDADMIRVLEQQVPLLPLPDQIEQLPDILTRLQKQWEKDLERITDPIARSRARMAGVKIPDWVQRLMNAETITNDPGSSTAVQKALPYLPEFNKKITIEGVEKPDPQNINRFTAWVAQQQLETHRAVVDIVLDALNKQAQAELDAAWAAMPDIQLPKSPFQLAIDEDRKKKGLPPLPNPTARPPKPTTSPAVDAIRKAEREAIAAAGPNAGIAIAGMSGYFNKSNDEMTDWIIDESIRTNTSIIETVKRILQERYDKAIQDATDPNSEGGKDITPDEQSHIDDLQRRKDSAESDFGGAGSAASSFLPDPDEQARKSIQEPADLRKSQIELRASENPRNKALQAQAEYDEALVDLQAAEEMFSKNLISQTDLNAARARANRAKANLDDIAGDGRAMEDALLDWADVWARGDPVKLNESAMRKAQVALQRAIDDGDQVAAEKARQDIQKLLFEADDNNADIIRSQMEVAAALVAEDPLQAAKKALDIARFELERARGTADENRKFAAVIAAEKGYANAITDGMDGTTALLIAIAQSNEDTVEVARLQHEQALRKLNEARAKGITDPKVLGPLQGAVETTATEMAKAAVSEEEESIDFMKDMGTITIGQALESYRALLARTKEGTAQYRELARKIKSLEQEATSGDDLQFNLPATLGIPTLYEARRMNQSTIAGIGYQDNRNIVMSLSVNGAQDPMVVANQVMAAFNSAMSSGNTRASGIGMGV